MQRLRELVIWVAVALGLSVLSAAPCLAFETVNVLEDVNAINLSNAIDRVDGDGGRVRLSTAPDADGIVRRIEVVAQDPETDPKWAIFALTNSSEVQFERLLVAPFYRMPNSGLLNPDLGGPRISVITGSSGLRPERVTDSEADVFNIVLDPGATVTIIAELSGDTLPELYLWEPSAYRAYLNSFTLFRGTVLGISGLAAVFLTIMFVVRGRGVFPATAAFAWSVLAYLLIDFGIFGPLLGVGNSHVQPYRAAAEAALSTTLFGFLFIYLNLHRWHLRFLHLALALAAIFLGLFAFAFFQPVAAIMVARGSFVLLAVAGALLIILLSVRGYDRAVLLVPTWIILLAWIAYAWSVVTGSVVTDLAQPAVAGGLVLLVMLIGFTTVQHAFAEGQVSVGTLSEVERRALALTGSGDFVFDWNLERDRVIVSEELNGRLGERRGALRGSIKLWFDRVHPEDRDRFRTVLDTLVEMKRGRVNSDIRLAVRDGTHRAFRLRAKPVLDNEGNVARIVGTLQDVTEDRAGRERLLHDAVYDSFSGLPLRKLLLDRLERALQRAKDGNAVKPAVMVVDIDKFSHVDEKLGAAAADSILLAVARRLARVMRPMDTLARLKADQFAVVLVAEDSANQIAEVADQMRRALRTPFNFGDKDITLTASIGITIYDNSPVSAADVLRDAELAMYYAKRLGGDRVEAYRVSARSIAAYSEATERDLERAMNEGELQLYYQPIYDTRDATMVGAEALLRWKHPTRGLVGPDEFIPLAERTGQIDKVGRLALRQATTYLGNWLNTYELSENFFISINVSAAQLSTETLLNDLRTIASENRRLPAHVKLELTETQVMSNPEQSAYVLNALKDLGFGLALDDFGTGHSSLSYLHRFPFDTVKIPAQFVRMSDEGGVSRTQGPIINAITSLAGELGLSVIGEGVETTDELKRLVQNNCMMAQGYVFEQALDSADFQRKLSIKRAGRSGTPESAPRNAVEND